MTDPDQTSTDDEIYAWFVRSIDHPGQAAREVEDGVIEVVLTEDDGVSSRVEVSISRAQLRRLAWSDIDIFDDSVEEDAPAANPVLAGLEALSFYAEETLATLRPDESFVVVFEGDFTGSTRRELPPRPGEAESFERFEGGFASAFPVDDPRFGEPGSIFGHRPGGETDMVSLIVSMDPVLDSGRYVFCTVEDELPVSTALVRIQDGRETTVVVDQQLADESGWDYSLVTAMVTPRVHSAPEVAQVTGPVAQALAERGISCKVVAGLQHDRLFVPHDRGWDVLQALEDLRDNVTGTRITRESPDSSATSP